MFCANDVINAFSLKKQPLLCFYFAGAKEGSKTHQDSSSSNRLYRIGRRRLKGTCLKTIRLFFHFKKSIVLYGEEVSNSSHFTQRGHISLG